MLVWPSGLNVWTWVTAVDLTVIRGQRSGSAGFDVIPYESGAPDVSPPKRSLGLQVKATGESMSHIDCRPGLVNSGRRSLQMNCCRVADQLR